MKSRMFLLIILSILCGSLAFAEVEKHWVCAEAQKNAVSSWVDYPVQIHLAGFYTYAGFVLSKAKAHRTDDFLYLRPTAYAQKSGYACKLRNNSAVAHILENPQLNPPQDNCLELNRRHLEAWNYLPNEVQFEEVTTQSGPEWVNMPIEYEIKHGAVVAKVPVLVTPFLEESSANVFYGVHYCKIVELENVMGQLKTLRSLQSRVQ